MTRRFGLLSLLLLSAARESDAQPKPLPAGKRRLGVLWLGARDDGTDDFARELNTALASFGWIVDRNLAVEWHMANGDVSRLSALAAEVVRSGPDAILTYHVPPTRALQLVTKTIPIVTSVGDPIGYGFTRSYARPDGNVTGLSLGYVESQRKTIEWLRVAVPAAKRLILAVNANRAPLAEGLTRTAIHAAVELGFVPEVTLVADAADLRAALQSDRASALIVYGFDGLSSPMKTGEIIAVSLSKKMAIVGSDSEHVKQGALLSYELYWDNPTQRNAAQLDKLFRGVSPAQIPFELPALSWLAVNAKTARTLGIELPQTLLARADEVIR